MKSLHRYYLGFGLSLALTLVAFGLAQVHGTSGHLFPSHAVLMLLFVLLALAQLVVQVVLFLHLDEEQKPRWNTVAFIFALFVVVIVVGGTLWIMYNLSHGQMQVPSIQSD